MDASNNKLNAFFILKLIGYLLSKPNPQNNSISPTLIEPIPNKNATKNCDNCIGDKYIEVVEHNENKHEHISMNPMANLLYILKVMGLIKIDIYFTDGKETRENVNIVSINNHFVEIFDIVTEENIIIPISQIAAVRSKSGSMPSIPENALIPIKTKENGYSEFLFVDFFKNNIGNKITVQTSSYLNVDEEITGVGEGIVVLNNNFAIEISKIRSIKIVPKI